MLSEDIEYQFHLSYLEFIMFVKKFLWVGTSNNVRIMEYISNINEKKSNRENRF